MTNLARMNPAFFGEEGRKRKSDEYYTPPEAMYPILPCLNKEWSFYECTSGKSMKMVDFLRGHGVSTLESGRRDFFEQLPPKMCYDAIITNPPFSNKDKFIERCYKIGKPFALLMPVEAFGGIGRGKMWMEHGVEVMVLDKRIDFSGDGRPYFNVAWFCKGILPRPLMFAKVEKRDE